MQTLGEENTKLSVDLSVKVNETKLLQSRCDRFDEELKSCTTELQNANMAVEKTRDQLKTYEVDNARLQENNCTKTAEIERLQDESGQWKHKAESECRQGFFTAIPAPCPKLPPRAKYVPTYV